MLNRKILVCNNLIGDSIYLLGPVKKFVQTREEECAAIVVEPTIAGELFYQTFEEKTPAHVLYSVESANRAFPGCELLRLEAGLAATICYAHARRHGRQLHISEGYARMLGVDIEGKLEPPIDWQSYPGQTFEKEYALISPFSRSCSRHTGERPNKTLDDWKWEPIIRMLRRHYGTVKVTAAPNDRLKGCSIPETDYLVSENLQQLELIIRKASVVISLDNGLSHLAASLGAKLVLLWPQVSNIDFIAPIWSPTTAICGIGDPNVAAPCFILDGIRKMLAWLEDGRK